MNRRNKRDLRVDFSANEMAGLTLYLAEQCGCADTTIIRCACGNVAGIGEDEDRARPVRARRDLQTAVVADIGGIAGHELAAEWRTTVIERAKFDHVAMRVLGETDPADEESPAGIH